jgi:hypothetical protein
MTQRRDRINTRSRTFADIRHDVLDSIPVLAPNWTSHGIDEPGMAILEILMAVADNLAYNQDRQNRENFLSLAVLPESVHELAYSLHYRPKRWVAGQGEIILSVPQNPARLAVTLPALTSFALKDGRRAVSLESISIPEGFSGQLSINAVEGEYRTFKTTVTPDNLNNLLLPVENIGEQLFEVFIDNELWYDATDHPLNSDLDNFYYIKKNEDGIYYLSFRASRGRIPSYGADVEVRYLRTSGQNFTAGVINPSQSPLPSSDIEWAYTDFTDASLPETLEAIRDRAPAKNATSDRAVTEGDYRELAKQLPNVKSVYVLKSQRGWNTVEVYVATKDGIPASVDQLDLVREFFEKRNNLIVSVRTLPANFKQFTLSVSIRVRNGFNGARVLNDVRAALADAYSYDNLNFSSTIRVSDVYAIVEGVSGVDYSTLRQLHWTAETPGVQSLISIGNEHPILNPDRLFVTLE